VPAGTPQQAADPGGRARSLLDAWERGRLESPGERALTLLAAADERAPRSQLRSLTVGARDRQLLELRRELFGTAVDAVVSCPRCGDQAELHFEVDAILVDAGEPRRSHVEVETEAGQLRVRLPTADDLAAAHAPADPDRALTVLLERLLLPAGDAPPPPAGELSAGTIDRIGTALAAADPQADMTFDVGCPACGTEYRTPFDVVAFVWGELGDWAVRLLGEVHTLARAYGWREQDTLALSPARRRFYIDAVSA
jgi:hypothetical protein